MLTSPTEQLQAQSTYIDGKMKRYSLMFAVNGGAFAIAKYRPEGSEVILGGLTLQHLALGAIVFTVAVAIDIYLFGDMIRKKYLGDLVFRWPGKVILVLLSLLLLGAWGLAAFS